MTTNALGGSPHRWAVLPAALLLGLLASTGHGAVEAVSTPGHPPAASRELAADQPRRWAGFAIPRTGRADGGWIGGYEADGVTLFVTSPSKRPNRGGFEAARVVEDLRGPGGASHEETVRAAWVLSKYGGYRDATQAAAVDAVVQHLLSGGAWKISRPHGSRRVRATRDPVAVRRFARIMLRQSRRDAAAHVASVTTVGTDLGGTVSATVAVTSRDGRPAAGLPVSFAFPGAEPVPAVTGDDGRAVARFPATRAGWQEVAATVAQVPEHRLFLHPPVRPRQAWAAQGGVRRILTAVAPAAVRGPQALTLDTAAIAQVAADVSVTVSVTGDGTPRTATAVLHGPFASAAAAQCSGQQAGSVSATVTGDGTYGLPPLQPSAGGYYLWSVEVAGTATSLPASACSKPVRVRALTTTSVSADSTLAPVGEVGASGVVSGLPYATPVTLGGTLFGPYGSEAQRAGDRCGTSHAGVNRTRTGNGPVHFTIEALQPGYYAWQAETPAGELWLGSRSPCLAEDSLLRVQ